MDGEETNLGRQWMSESKAGQELSVKREID
jgi:hypothetical protein